MATESFDGTVGLDSIGKFFTSKSESNYYALTRAEQLLLDLHLRDRHTFPKSTGFDFIDMTSGSRFHLFVPLKWRFTEVVERPSTITT